MTSPGPESFSKFSDAELKRIAAESPPSDPQWRAALIEEINRRAGHVRAAFAKPPDPQRVTVTDIDMPFASMVSFMVKWAIASIPAFIIVAILVFICVAVLGGLGADLRR
jgi:hypothetical protein